MPKKKSDKSKPFRITSFLGNYLLPFLVLVIFSFIFVLLPNNKIDPDGFYHFKRALVYQENGIFYNIFPWTQFSVIKDMGSDLWYGFHLFFLPITYVDPGVIGLQIATQTALVLGLFLFYLSLKRLMVAIPFYWTLFFLFVARRVFLRFSLFRPHVVSFGLVMLFFSLLACAKKNSRRSHFIALFVLAALIAWIHINIAWLPLLILLVVGIYKFIFEKEKIWREGVVSLAGIFLGLVARPNPFGSLKLSLINLSTLFTKKEGINLLNVGGELKPFSFEIFLENSPYFILFVLSVLALMVWMGRGRLKSAFESIKASSIPALILIAFFFYLTFFKASRGIDYFIGFSILSASLITSAIINKSPKAKKVVFVSAGVLLLASSIFSVNRYLKLIQAFETVGNDPLSFKDVSSWLSNHSTKGEIVFHPEWDYFGPLFFWNNHNYYINGMDPIFEYRKDENLYWKNHHLSLDENPKKVCDKPICGAGNYQNADEVLKADFQASYVLVAERTHPNLYSFLKEEGYKIEYQDSDFAVFNLK